MPIQIQVATIAPDSTKVFTFSDVITQNMVGLSAFSLTYGNTDHHIQTMSIALSVSQSGRTLSVKPHAVLMDKSGNNLDPGASSITVAAIAWVGVNNSNLTLANANGISNNGASLPITISGTNPRILQAALSGYYLSYGDTDHHLETACAAVGTTLNGDTAAITGVVYMYDDTGHGQAAASVNGGLFASTDPSLGAQVVPTGSLQNTSQTIEFDQRVSQAFALLTSYKVQFQSNADHHVKTIAGNLTVQPPSGNSVKVSGAATITDNSGHSQDNAVSQVSGFVIGY